MTASDWADVARRRHAEYAALVEAWRPGDPTVAVASRERALADMVPHLVAEIDRLRMFEAAVTSALAQASGDYRNHIVAVRCAGPNADADYWRWCGQATGIRQTIDALAKRAGVEPPDWEQIKASVPADGVYR